MRLGVLDIGSNTGHLLVVDAHGGAAPLPAFSYKEPLRLAEHLVVGGPGDGEVSATGIDALAEFTAGALVVALVVLRAFPRLLGEETQQVVARVLPFVSAPWAAPLPAAVPRGMPR